MQSHWLCGAATAALMTLCSTAAAQNLDARSSWYVQTGAGDASSHALVIGTTQPWQHTGWSLGSGKLRGHWDIWLGGWSNKDLEGDRFHTPALGAGPSLRWRGAEGTSAWYLEAGTSIMVTGKRLYRSGERMGTRWNFASHLGIGMNFGARQAHELSLRLQHASNAGIKRPNPGINFVQLRYAHAF